MEASRAVNFEKQLCEAALLECQKWPGFRIGRVSHRAPCQFRNTAVAEAPTPTSDLLELFPPIPPRLLYAGLLRNERRERCIGRLDSVLGGR